MFIVSFLLCLLRAAIVAMGFVGVALLPVDHPAMKTAYLEIGTGIGMVLCGISGNALLLAKKQIGVYLGWGLIAFTIGSILTGIAAILITGGTLGPKAPPGQETARFVGMVVGAVISVAIRVSIIVAYGAALIQFHNWYSRYGGDAKTY